MKNINDFIESENLQVKGQLWGTLMGIAYSTAHGIVFNTTQGTFSGGVILPVIDPKKLAVDE